METEFEDYIGKMKNIQDKILEFINHKCKMEENYQNLIRLFNDQINPKKKEEIKTILYLISKISDNHHREAHFLPKIEKILLFFSEQITDHFTSEEMFHFFKHNKVILLFLIKNKLMAFDEVIFNFLMKKKYKSRNYAFYFSPEIKQFLSEIPVSSDNEQTSMSGHEDNEIDYEIILNKIPEDFEEKRIQGENDDFDVYALIRKDSIDQFQTYIDFNEFPLDKSIKPSIFESNSFLLKREAKLIEYAAFFGSIQIFKYLFSKQVEITPDIWLYAIHSNSIDLIHFIEANYKGNVSYELCFKEAIKCHHNQLADHIQYNFLNQIELDSKIHNNPDENYYLYAFHYFNFKFFPRNSNNKFIIYYLCEYDYLDLIELLLKSKWVDLNVKIQIFFLMIYRI